MKAQIERRAKNSVALSDVARVAGVSTATVSLALQEGSRISAATREKVRRAMEQTGYRYNRFAAKLRTGQSKTIGLMITDIANPYFAALAAGVETVLYRSGYMTFLVNSNDDGIRQSMQIERLLEHGVDGLLLSPADGTNLEELNQILGAGTPIVQISRWLSGLSCDAVGPDNQTLAAEMTRHLLNLGHRRIAFLGGTEGRSARVERLAGYAQAMEEAELQVEETLTPMAAPTRANGALLLIEMMALESPPTAVICYHDLMALGALQAAKDMGLAVGSKFAVVGFDDITEAELSRPSLTTVHIDAENIGRAAATRLLARLEGDESPPSRIMVPARLVVRDSCGGYLRNAAVSHDIS
ncbi:LacI family DNA-binding transcriptional regulator [Ensifer sp. YR511]|uniref:LacI family DNA-binding transcriptional regulator n=1 Tax=Ensifer sp. YR511 TaxID=1855294 RepID=UPI00088B1EAF|nr:LacI family DNA-binding transcriptional regulator [Ensifer sp. YR511]SDO07450.1 transcriptional regulator, LacI family [Ensifer sp. YR511]